MLCLGEQLWPRLIILMGSTCGTLSSFPTAALCVPTSHPSREARAPLLPPELWCCCQLVLESQTQRNWSSCEPGHSAWFTHHHVGEGLSLQGELLTKHRIKTLIFSRVWGTKEKSDMGATLAMLPLSFLLTWTMRKKQIRTQKLDYK